MKNWHALVICLFVSSSIWLVMNLTRTNIDLENVPVLAVSNIEGYSSEASEEVLIAARCKASGFKLIRLASTRTPVKVVFNASDLRPSGKDCFTIEQADLYKYVQDIFGPGVSIESFVSRSPEFRFVPVRFKRVPVVAVKYIDFEPEYMASGPVRFKPDSVLVYGEDSALAQVDAVYTMPISRKSVKRDMRGVAGLEVPAGVRLSDEHVDYFLPVTRYVELKSEFKVSVSHVPSSAHLAVFPSSVHVTFRCSFPMTDNPLETASCVIDYKDFRNSLSGNCLVRLDGLPPSVIDYRIEPEVCDCVETVL